METINWLQVIVEIFILIAGFIAMYWKSRVDAERRFTKLETLVEGLGEDHRNLNEQVGGISRHVAEISGYLEHMKVNGGNNG